MSRARAPHVLRSVMFVFDIEAVHHIFHYSVLSFIILTGCRVSTMVLKPHGGYQSQWCLLSALSAAAVAAIDLLISNVYLLCEWILPSKCAYHVHFKWWRPDNQVNKYCQCQSRHDDMKNVTFFSTQDLRANIFSSTVLTCCG